MATRCSQRTVGLFLDHPRVPGRPAEGGRRPRRIGRGTAATQQEQQQPRRLAGGGQDLVRRRRRRRRRQTTTTTTTTTASSPAAAQPAPPVPGSESSELLRRADHPPVMTRVDLAFPSMGGEARVRLESVLHDQAELEALADGIHSRDRGGRDGALALPPRQRAERAQPRPAPGRARLPAAAPRRRRRRCGRPGAAAGSSTRRCSASSSARATSSRGTARSAPTSTSRWPPLPRAVRPRPPPGGSRTGSGSTRRGASCARPASGSTPAGIAKGMAADLAAASLPAGVRYAISCGGDLAVGGERPWDVAVAERPHRGRGPPAARAHRRRRDLGDRRAHLARRGRALRPPRARPGHRPPGVDRARRGDGRRRQRARGRGAREDRAAVGPARRARACCGAAAACCSTTTAASRSFPPPRWCGCRGPSRREHGPARLPVLAGEPVGGRRRVRCC